jgi:hypothetical protein
MLTAKEMRAKAEELSRESIINPLIDRLEEAMLRAVSLGESQIFYYPTSHMEQAFMRPVVEELKQLGYSSNWYGGVDGVFLKISWQNLDTY